MAWILLLTSLVLIHQVVCGHDGLEVTIPSHSSRFRRQAESVPQRFLSQSQSSVSSFGAQSQSFSPSVGAQSQSFPSSFGAQSQSFSPSIGAQSQSGTSRFRSEVPTNLGSVRGGSSVSSSGGNRFGGDAFSGSRGGNRFGSDSFSGGGGGGGGGTSFGGVLFGTTATAEASGAFDCRGKPAGTVFTIDNDRRYITCLGNGKSDIQSCPRSLYYRKDIQRCDQRRGPMEDVCASAPCRNGGVCSAIGSTFQCTCPPGFTGHICDRDASFCSTQNPCGSAPGTTCQSFSQTASLTHVCIFRNRAFYGRQEGETIPSPCLGDSGPFPLVYTSAGFIRCDSERMFIEACPARTSFTLAAKACV